jgi:hypothetical protein
MSTIDPAESGQSAVGAVADRDSADAADAIVGGVSGQTLSGLGSGDTPETASGTSTVYGLASDIADPSEETEGIAAAPPSDDWRLPSWQGESLFDRDGALATAQSAAAASPLVVLTALALDSSAGTPIGLPPAQDDQLAVGASWGPPRFGLTVAVVAPIAPGQIATGTPTPAELGLPAEFAPVSPSSIQPRVLGAISDVADQVVQGNTATGEFGVTGAGIKIGIISDSFDYLGGEANDIAAGDLPSDIMTQVLNDNRAGGGLDEGRAMAQIVYSIAPGAQIYFYSVGNSTGSSQQTMAQAIAGLQDAGCNIIVDDWRFATEPFFQITGPIDSAINSFVASGGVYFTAAQNASNSYYQAKFTPVETLFSALGLVEAEDFGGDSTTERIVIPADRTVMMALEWEQPYLSSTTDSNDLRFYLLNTSNGQVVDESGSIATGVAGESDPAQFLYFDNKTQPSQTLNLAIVETGAQDPGTFKIIMNDDSNPVVQFETPSGNPDPNAGVGSGSVMGHALDPNAIVVGAAPETDPTTMELFSSTGPGELLFDSSGNLLATPTSANEVDITGPDGNMVSYNFPGDSTTNGFSNSGDFFGTSAAAPAVAAVGALVLQQDPLLTPAEVEGIMEDTAVDDVAATSAYDLSSPTDQTGAGLVDAAAAVGMAASILSNLTPTQVAALTTTDFASFTPQALKVLTSAEFVALTAAQVGSLTTTEIDVLGSAFFAALGTTGLGGLSTVQAGELAATLVADLAPAQLGDLTPAALDHLGAVNLDSLTPAQIDGLTPKQLSNVAVATLASLSTLQVAALTTGQIGALNAAGLHGLGVTNLDAMTTTQLASLTVAQFAGVNSVALGGFSSGDIVALVTTVVAALTTKQVAGLTDSELGALTAFQLGSLSTADIVVLTTTQIAGLTQDQFRSFASSQILALTTTGVASLAAAQVYGLTGSDITAMTNSQIQALTPGAMLGFSADQIGSFTSGQLQAMSTQQYAAILG